VYDILNHLGLLCWDENRDFSPAYVQDMEDLVRRDRNHPSVVIWSTCNEMECVVKGPNNITTLRMREATKRWDTTRPFSANVLYGLEDINLIYSNLSAHLDVEGFSHGFLPRYAPTVHGMWPNRTIVSSECCSCQMQRSEVFASSAHHIESINQATCLGACMTNVVPKPGPDMGVVAGSLGVWTLFDYAGEPGKWPNVVSSYGQFDYAGFAKSSASWYRSLWLASVDQDDAGRPPLPPTHVVRVSQEWNVPQDDKSLKMDVAVFSDLPLIELVLNGNSLGEVDCSPLSFATFKDVPYTAGNLTALGRLTKGGEVLASHIQLAPNIPHAIVLSLDAPSVLTGTGSSLLLDGHDAALVRATVVDAQGLVVGSADNAITFTIQQGPGRVYGVHNGNVSSHEPQLVASRLAYHGLARAVVKVTVDAASVPVDWLKLLADEVEIDPSGKSGGVVVQPASTAPYPDIIITASSPGLRGGKVNIPVSTDVAQHSVLAVASANINGDLRFD
jgi:hypothetical protein